MSSACRDAYRKSRNLISCHDWGDGLVNRALQGILRHGRASSVDQHAEEEACYRYGGNCSEFHPAASPHANGVQDISATIAGRASPVVCCSIRDYSTVLPLTPTRSCRAASMSRRKRRG